MLQKTGLGMQLQVGTSVFMIWNVISQSFTVTTPKPTIQHDDTDCGAESFMLRDGVCDEATNIAKCLYDGGDCCRENKDKTLCSDCKCILTVNLWELIKDFDDKKVKPVENPENLKRVIDKWTVEVANVDSNQVCAVLCLDHKMAAELNAWHYLANVRICRCGWAHSAACPEKLVVGNWEWKNDTNNDDKNVSSPIDQYSAFVKLAKTVSCGKINFIPDYCLF